MPDWYSQLSPRAKAAVDEALNRLGSSGPFADMEHKPPLDDVASQLTEAEFKEIIDYCVDMIENQPSEWWAEISEIVGELIACRIFVAPQTALPTISLELLDPKHRLFFLSHLTPDLVLYYTNRPFKFEGAPPHFLPFVEPLVERAEYLEGDELRSLAHTIALCQHDRAREMLQQMAGRFPAGSKSREYVEDVSGRWFQTNSIAPSSG